MEQIIFSSSMAFLGLTKQLQCWHLLLLFEACGDVTSACRYRLSERVWSKGRNASHHCLLSWAELTFLKSFFWIKYVPAFSLENNYSRQIVLAMCTTASRLHRFSCVFPFKIWWILKSSGERCKTERRTFNHTRTVRNDCLLDFNGTCERDISV